MTTIAKSALGAAVALWALTAGHAQALTIALANSFSFGGSSYRTYYADQAISWTEARNQALSLGGGYDLASINSQAENDLIFAYIHNPLLWNGGTAYGRGGPWIGLFQPAGSPQPAGGWQWVDGTSALSPNYNNWSPGQPDNRSVLGIQVEGYGQFFGNGRWNDQENYVSEPSLIPDQPFGFVVEAPGPALTFTLANSFNFGGSLYRTYYANQIISWTEARNHALSLGGGFDLVSINSQAENDLIFANINNPSLWNGGTAYGRGGPWIGLFQPTGSPEPAGGWQWVDGTSAINPYYNNWSVNQPDNRSVLGIQVEEYGQFFGNGRWNDQENYVSEPSLIPDQPFGFVVEAPAAPGPLPIFGAAAAFGFSRKLRRRIRNSVNPVSSSDTI
jgi:hypothetical protein